MSENGKKGEASMKAKMRHAESVIMKRHIDCVVPLTEEFAVKLL